MNDVREYRLPIKSAAIAAATELARHHGCITLFGDTFRWIGERHNVSVFDDGGEWVIAVRTLVDCG